MDRPSRFDRLYRVSDPNEKCRAILLEHHLGRAVESAEAQETKGLSTAALREACLLVRLKNVSLSEAIQQLKRHKELVKREFGAIGELGFSSKRYFDDGVDECFSGF